jgi:hypothetical protein
LAALNNCHRKRNTPRVIGAFVNSKNFSRELIDGGSHSQGPDENNALPRSKLTIIYAD